MHVILANHLYQLSSPLLDIQLIKQSEAALGWFYGQRMGHTGL